ncbi:MAG TPA: Maf family protein [Candidatus Macondimonas sp.]|nr:Maf family protein [Candidatus Macondimonas sp.]
MNQPDLYLASASPRRRDLLALLKVLYKELAIDCDESLRAGETPRAYVRRLALTKAGCGACLVNDERPVLGADTAVVVGDNILGKPRDRAHGMAMLASLSGREHRVLTAVAVVQGRRRHVVVSDSRVTFASTTPEERAAYWDTGEPIDKAGAYAIQGLGAIFITRIRGSPSGIMGLPLRETALLLREFSVPVFPWNGSFGRNW